MWSNNNNKKGIENFKAAIADNVLCQRSVYTKIIGRVVQYIKVQIEEKFWCKTNAEIRKTMQLEKDAEKDGGTVKG